MDYLPVSRYMTKRDHSQQGSRQVDEWMSAGLPTSPLAELFAKLAHDGERNMSKKEQAVARLLLRHRDADPSGWYWINAPGLKRLSKKRANKYLLACTLDYQMSDGAPWENAKRFAEDDLRNPASLWECITSAPLSVWKRKFRVYGLHRFPKAHERVWKIGKRVVEWYSGDARKIWEGSATADVLERLLELGVGEQLSRMAVGGLRDCGWIKGRADVKADSHVTCSWQSV